MASMLSLQDVISLSRLVWVRADMFFKGANSDFSQLEKLEKNFSCCNHAIYVTTSKLKWTHQKAKLQLLFAVEMYMF